MQQVNDFNTRNELDEALATKVANELNKAITEKGKASLAVSGGSTPKGFFKALSQIDLAWDKVTITLADERWVDFESDASNTRLVHENLLQNNAKAATFFHIKKGELLSDSTLAELNIAAKESLLPLDVLILGMGEDGHTASLFPCSDQIKQGLSLDNTDALMKVVPKTAPNDRITFTFSHLIQSKNIILHVCGESKKTVLAQANAGADFFEMPIRAFLQDQKVTTQVYWAE
ncbi:MULTISPECIES: 6-phosphogluconolactonase [Colwelliaceae]|uniref:6-phosphogluconolactonase n=1 Tax=Colwelliaceae TaxID=267889 RepID=UPI000970ACBC|nr:MULTISPECIES: 6-phosphogluconolactonase [Colwelliaceae]